MQILKQVTAHPFSLKLKGHLSWGKSSRLDSLEHVLIRAETKDGLIGLAEAPARPSIYGETPESICTIIQKHLSPMLDGLAIDDTEAIAYALSSIANNQTAKGALDIALCELRAKANGQTLEQAWSGQSESIATSFILGINDLDIMLAEARSIVEQGVHVLKIKIGRDEKKDEALIAALQHEFKGESVTLYADANETLEPKTAATRLEKLAKLGIQYVEEPLPVHLLKERSILKREGIMPIVADDSCFSSQDLQRELSFDTFDILNIKTARSGFTESDRMLRLAQDARKGIMLGSQASSGLGTVHTAIFANYANTQYPCELSFPLKLEEDSLSERLRYKNGLLEMDEVRQAALRPDFVRTD